MINESPSSGRRPVFPRPNTLGNEDQHRLTKKEDIRHNNRGRLAFPPNRKEVIRDTGSSKAADSLETHLLIKPLDPTLQILQLLGLEILAVDRAGRRGSWSASPHRSSGRRGLSWRRAPRSSRMVRPARRSCVRSSRRTLCPAPPGTPAARPCRCSGATSAV